ncbi:MAG: YdcF family protein [Thiofilum sp.]|uniref:YdcF family protein n=1 Tax=Thiofilum sp. TaxID=2212733 RepID=UPI0025E3A30D|nr:YdcF family protein [Thiofilum sp.]MBK8452903.1 YdcF family protein [Thiofilum sp.]
MSILWVRSFEFLILPPGNLLLITLMALLLWLFKRPRLAVTLVVLGWLQIILLATPATSAWLLRDLQNRYPAQAELWKTTPLPEAIVVLGAGRNELASEYGGETSSNTGLERLRYAALLHRETQLPILISGGSPQPEKLSEAEMMRSVLENEFKVPVRWVETQSHTTLQNAEFTDQILANAEIKSAWLVTQSWHMPRSLLAFQKREVNYIPASCSFGGSIAWHYGLTNWTPQSSALERSVLALHEYFGLAWYTLQRKVSN